MFFQRDEFFDGLSNSAFTGEIKILRVRSNCRTKPDLISFTGSSFFRKRAGRFRSRKIFFGISENFSDFLLISSLIILKISGKKSKFNLNLYF